MKNQIKDESIDLVVTSPPYPMIQMWDEIFSSMNPKIKVALDNQNANLAFELMNKELDKVWNELYRVVKKNGFVCINIGDATRTMKNIFQLHMNSSRITTKMIDLGFVSLPPIIWKKTTNAPNKFMGSGMLPAGAYVTLENEWILIFRKEGKRIFSTKKEKENRQKSAFFWEERNVWFSNIWNIKGEKQKSINGEKRERTAAYPLELTNRLINMYSVYGDTILDPFLGTGTTTISSALLGRNSIGFEIDESIINGLESNIINLKMQSPIYYQDRINSHSLFVDNYKKKMKYYNSNLGCGVMTSQEKNIEFYIIDNIINENKSYFEVSYTKS
jgi:DNA modification methylase